MLRPVPGRKTEKLACKGRLYVDDFSTFAYSSMSDFVDVTIDLTFKDSGELEDCHYTEAPNSGKGTITLEDLIKRIQIEKAPAN